MRYYELDANGKIIGSYAVLQPNKNLVLLESPEDENLSTYDGSKWIFDLTTAKEYKVEELKSMMRINLATRIGDYGDNISDLTKAVVMGECIRAGIIKDEEIIKGFTEYCQNLLQGYGGEKAVLDILNQGALALGQELIGKYYPALAMVESATDKASLDAVTL
jgi:hypothetical protein